MDIWEKRVSPGVDVGQGHRASSPSRVSTTTYFKRRWSALRTMQPLLERSTS
jgi:hypothetical protein